MRLTAWLFCVDLCLQLCMHESNVQCYACMNFFSLIRWCSKILHIIALKFMNFWSNCSVADASFLALIFVCLIFVGNLWVTVLLYYFCTFRELLERKKLDFYLSSALGVPLINGKLQDIDDSHYVLTLDYTIKVSVGIEFCICVS